MAVRSATIEDLLDVRQANLSLLSQGLSDEVSALIKYKPLEHTKPGCDMSGTYLHFVVFHMWYHSLVYDK